MDVMYGPAANPLLTTRDSILMSLKLNSERDGILIIAEESNIPENRNPCL